MEVIRALDERLFFLINRDTANPLFDLVMPFVTEKDHLIIPAIIGLFLMVALERERRKVLLFLSIFFLGLAVADQTGSILKDIFQRVRPCRIYDVRLLSGCTTSYSMPSSHALNAFFGAAFLSGRYRRLSIPFFALAFLIAYSRVYVGVHYPGDVVVGSLIGLLMGLLLVFLHRKVESLFFKEAPCG